MHASDRIHYFGGFLLRIGLAGFAGMVWLLEMLGSDDWTIRLALIPGLAGTALVLFPQHLPKWAIAVGAASLVTTIGLRLAADMFHGRDTSMLSPGMSEVIAMLILTAWTVRLWNARFGHLGSILLVVALLGYPLRLPIGLRVIALEMLILIALVMAVALGLYLRSVDARRRRSLHEVRRGERVDLARDLHDFVAHHVTGIVVQAQAAQYVVEQDPARARESFAAIEKSGLEALTSMRRLVAVLREDDGAGTRPLGDLEQVAGLVSSFSVGDSYCSLYVSPDIDPGSVPPEIAATVHRVVQEALTNVRKHAPAVTTVAVAVTSVPDGLEVAIRDGGGNTARGRLAGSGGGFGLAGLSERVTALGGTLAAGPRPEGGWEVVAILPLEVPAVSREERT